MSASPKNNQSTDQILDEVLLEAINEGWFLRSKQDYPKGFTANDIKKIQENAKQQIKEHFIARDLVEGAIPEGKQLNSGDLADMASGVFLERANKIGFNQAIRIVRKNLNLGDS